MSAVINSGVYITAPVSALTQATGGASGSMATSGTYLYKVTYVTQYGETTGSPASAGATATNGSMNLTAIPVSPDTNVIARKVYRTQAGGSTYTLLTTISDDLTTTFTDTASDSSIVSNASIPTMNSAPSVQEVKGWFKVALPQVISSDQPESGGTTQADGTPLSADVRIHFVSQGDTGPAVVLPEVNSRLVDLDLIISNRDAITDLVVFPHGSDTINGGSAGASVTVAAGETLHFHVVAYSTAADWLTY